jgi:hypothetical protein
MWQHSADKIYFKINPDEKKTITQRHKKMIMHVKGPAAKKKLIHHLSKIIKKDFIR